MSLLDFQRETDGEGPEPQVLAGVVADDAASTADLVRVVVPEFDPELAHGPCPWTPVVRPDGVYFPKAGDRCQLGQPEGGEPWIVGWTPAASVPDAPIVAEAGTTIISGTVPPSSGVGEDGDFYIDTLGQMVYGPKASGVWPAGASMVGTSGFVASDTPPGSTDLLWLDTDTPGTAALPPGGSTGEVLTKKSGGDFDTEWAAGGGGGGGGFDTAGDGLVGNGSTISADFGTASKKVAEGDDARFPTSGQKAALAGTEGTPGSNNKFVTSTDPRNTNARTPTAHDHPQSEVTGLETALSNKAASSDARFPTSDEKAALAGTSGSPASGNKYVTDSDGRLTDSRTPTAHDHDPDEVKTTGASQGDVLTVGSQGDAEWAAPTGGGGGGTFDTAGDGLKASGSKIEADFGTVAKKVAEGDDSRFPSGGQKDALAGTSGTPGSGNKYVTNADARLTDTRTPKAHDHSVNDIRKGNGSDGQVVTLVAGVAEWQAAPGGDGGVKPESLDWSKSQDAGYYVPVAAFTTLDEWEAGGFGAVDARMLFADASGASTGDVLTFDDTTGVPTWSAPQGGGGSSPGPWVAWEDATENGFENGWEDGADYGLAPFEVRVEGDRLVFRGVAWGMSAIDDTVGQLKAAFRPATERQKLVIIIDGSFSPVLAVLIVGDDGAVGTVAGSVLPLEDVTVFLS